VAKVKDFGKKDSTTYLPMLLLYVAITFLITGCASDPISIKNISSIPKDENIVFGQIKALNMGEEPSFKILIRTDKSRSEKATLIDQDGYFLWHLKPGNYIITAFKRSVWWAQSVGWGRIWVTFEVKKDSPITYIGTMDLIGGAVSKTVIRNNIDTARERLKKYNLREENISVNLMKREDF
jgi:hypothetical protein